MVDSSAFVDLLAQRTHTELETWLERPGVELHVPALCDAEIIAALRQMVRRGALDRARAYEALDDYADLPVRRHAHTGLLHRAFGLETFSAYDALYVALAEQLQAPLLTTDARLARAIASSTTLGVSLA